MEENTPPDIVVLGHIAIDTNKFPQGMIESAIGGAPTYAGLVIAALKKKVGIVSKIGVDFTEQFPPIYSKLGLDTEGILVSGENTTTFENVYDERGNRTQLCKHIAPPITFENIPASYLNAKGFYISPLANEIAPETIEKIKKRDNLVMMDPQGLFRHVDEKGGVTIKSDIDLKPFLKNVDVVKLGKDEADAFKKEPKKLLEEFCKLGPKIAIITQGDKPSLILSNGEFHEVPSLKVEARDLTGAGDVFGGAFLARYIETCDVVESARFASAAAGLKIRYKGPIGFPSENEILATIKR
jgi:sugar/nucleoside kinase (ribokinase family)